MTVVKEIYNTDISEYIVSSKSCKLTNGCILESQYGQVTLDFSRHKDIDSCTIYAKKASGNGRVLITNGTEVQTHLIISRNKQQIKLNLSESKKVEFHRNNTCTGDVHIFGFILESSTPPATKEESKPWRSIIKRCGKYNKIVLSENKLLASEGGCFSDKHLIKSIKTKPPNLCRETKSGYVFIKSCEITEIELTDSASQPTANKELYPAFESPNKIKATSTPNQMIFDSSGYNMANLKNKNIVASANKRNIIIDREGFVDIPISGLEPLQQYTIIAEGNKLKGNGKVELCIMNGNIVVSSVVFIFNEMVQPRRVTLATDNSSDLNFALRVQRPPGAVGTINLHKLLVMSGGEKPLDASGHVAMLGLMKEHSRIMNLEPHFTIIENDMEKAHGVYKMPKNEDLKFVIVIPTYKNSEWVERNLESVFCQDQKNYRVIFVDDCSPDDTFEKAQSIIEKHKEEDRVTLIKNTERKGALHNLYDSIHSCEDNEIVITLDGDDWFANDKVLNKLTDSYVDENVWMTYGQYQSWPDNGAGCSRQIPKHITAHNLFRQYGWCSSHLRTFYSWLFKKIKKEDLLDTSGNFYPMAWDLAFQMPMLEMCGPHAIFLSDVMYIYNIANPINDSKVNLKLQQSLEREIRAKPKYDRI